MSQEHESLVGRLAARLLPEGSIGPDRHLRLYLGFVFTLFIPATLVFAWTDWQRGERVTSVLVAIIALILISSIHTLRTARDIRWGYRAVLGPAVALLTAVLYLGGGGGYAALWYYAFPAGFYYVFGTKEGTLWVASLVVPAAVVLLTEVGATYPPEMAWRFLVTFSLMTALALGLQLARDALYDEVARDRDLIEEALAQVRTLSEMLPMCAWCGKVRDDEGYWTRIEEYLGNEAGTQVSHGICGDCEAKFEAETPPLLQAPPRA